MKTEKGNREFSSSH